MTAQIVSYTAVAVLIALAWSTLWIGLSHLLFHLDHRRRGLTYPRLGLSGWTRFYLRTAGSIVRLLGWRLRSPFSPRVRRPEGGREATPVLCVHGFHMNGAAMWGIRRTLEMEGRSTLAVSMGAPWSPAASYARALARGWRDLVAASPDGRIDVVAHSMGGLITRLVLAGDPALAASLRRVVTLGTPHHGAALVRWLTFATAYAMMHRGSPFLHTLPTFEETAPGAEATTVASAHDLLVYPPTTAHLEGARPVTLSGVGHLGLLTEVRVRTLVAEVLGGATGPSDQPSSPSRKET